MATRDALADRRQPKHDMRIEVMAVTPKMATKWLENPIPNQRKVRDSVVERYKHDMLSGHWRLTHQGIALDEQGRLIDGQHRLWAIVEGDVTITMPVCFGAPADAFDHLDLGEARSAVDICRIGGDTWITAEHIAVAKWIENSGKLRELTIGRSAFELKKIVEGHRAALEFLFQVVPRKVRFVTRSPVLGAVGSAWYHETEKTRLAQFLNMLRSGVSTGDPADAAVIRLRDQFTSDKRAGYSASVEIFLRTSRVVKAFMDGERLVKLYTPTSAPYVVKPVLKN